MIRRLLKAIAFRLILPLILLLGVLNLANTLIQARLPELTIPAFSAQQHSPQIKILGVNGELIAHRGGEHHAAVPLDELPKHVAAAVMAIEDQRFYSHFGVDPLAVVRAFIANERAGKIVQGGSTITQQTAKLLYLDAERTWQRKWRELVLALSLEQQYSKQEILSAYLNRVYLGSGNYGIEAASWEYFGKSARDLNLSEAAMVAGLLRAPSRFAPTRNLQRAQNRAAIVLDRMLAVGAITSAEATVAKRHPAKLVPPLQQKKSSYFIDWVLRALPAELRASRQDLQIKTSLDPSLQAAAEWQLAQIFSERGAQLDNTQVSLVVLTPDGAVRAMVGGRSYAASQFNRVTSARRQPGSAFKPFVYLAALEAGYAPENFLYDEPVAVGDWRPSNYGGGYRGPVSLSAALAKSINTVAVKLSENVGRDQVIDAARRSGISSDLQDVPSLPLGTHEVSLLELTRAYAPLANGGFGAPSYGLLEVRNGEGEILYKRRRPSPKRVLAARVVRDMNRMLSDVLISGTGQAAALEHWPAAGKTGTSQRASDAWFVGYTANLVAGVWLGRDDGAPMGEMSGGQLPAEIWRELMQLAHASVEPRVLPYLDRMNFSEDSDPRHAVIVQALDEFDGSTSRYNPAASWRRDRLGRQALARDY